MKTGNPKQAAILGIVAVGAIGFLGSSIFSTFASGSTPAPTKEYVAEHEQKSAEPGSASVEKLPDTEPDDSRADIGEADLPPKIEKTPFRQPAQKKADGGSDEKGQVAPLAKVKRKGTNSSGSSEETLPVDPNGVTPPTLPGTDGMTPGGGDSSTSGKEPPKPVMIRFEGYVDAGNPVAIVRIGDSQYTADQGEGLPYGIRVIAITSEKLTLSIRGRRQSVWIGREVQL